MRRKLFQIITVIAFSMWLLPTALLAYNRPLALNQGGGSDDQKYAGTWVGTYTTTEGESNSLTYVLRKDDKGQWGGTLKYINQEGEQVATFGSLQIADGKFKARFAAPGDIDITLVGQFKGDLLEGSYSVSPAGSADVIDGGSWKLTKSATAKTDK